MEILSSSSSSSSLSTTMKTKKSALIILSICIASLAVILELSQSLTLETLKNHWTIYWLNLKLKPSYLYILINCIIISIVASSKLHPCEKTSLPVEEREYHPFVAAEEVKGEMDVVEEVKEVVLGYAAREGKKDDEVVVEAEAETEKAAEMEKEKVSYSSRFGNRKPVKSSPEGKTALKKVTRPKRQETLESTWRTITEGRSMPLKRHLRKSDTITGASQDASPPPVHVMKKSDTFSHGGPAESPSPSSSGGTIRRDPSLSQDDLNRRVEAFIKKFNEEMRLQRQESFKNYQQVNRQGVY